MGRERLSAGNGRPGRGIGGGGARWTSVSGAGGCARGGTSMRVARSQAISLRVSGISPGWRGLGVLGGGGYAEEGQGEHGEGDPPVPGGPGADLVFVQAGQAFAGLEVLLRSSGSRRCAPRWPAERVAAPSSGRRQVRGCCGCGGSAASNGRDDPIGWLSRPRRTSAAPWRPAGGQSGRAAPSAGLCARCYPC